MNEIINHYVDQHTAAVANLAGNGIDWLCQQRQHGIDVFSETGFPGLREEDWRYTSLKPVTARLFQVNVDTPKSEIDMDGLLLDGLDSYRLVFIDGSFYPQHSVLPEENNASMVEALSGAISKHPQNVQQSMSDGVAMEHGFAALNIAFSSDGYVVQVSDNTRLDKPLEMIFISAGDNIAAQPRNTLKVGMHAQAVVIERYITVGEVSTLCNSTSKISLDEGARLDYYLIQTQKSSGYQVSTVEVEQDKDSWFGSRTITLGGALVRNNLTVSLNKTGAHCDMIGLYNISGKQHVDNHTNVVHNAPHCTSRELYKGVLDQRARAVFHGRIKVAQGAQKTDATQANNNLLLSSNAEIDTKPQLEIYADDVKCAHGATVGQIDETALFYLRSRGIDEKNARSLLTFAFVNDVLDEVQIAPLRAALEKVLADRLIEND